ncbi:hypothetical protein COY95_00265, partial [Candidatus Woesearchaeota archaeon CG_4_10_14_0_8_um_filter_47_5]
MLEIDLRILDLQSYPTVGGLWTVRFNATGKANLTISATNGTTYTEVYADNNTTSDDLELWQLRCGNTILFDKQINISKSSVLFILGNGTQVSVSATEGKQLPLHSLFIADYFCNATGYHTVKVLTPGKHTQRFDFGSVYGYANNMAQLGGSLENLTIWDDTDSEKKDKVDRTFFYATFINKTSGNSIAGVNDSCNIRFDYSGGWET